MPSTATYFDAANLMFLAGVTDGCVGSSDPSTRMFCPNDSVTREEMAAFIVPGRYRNFDARHLQPDPVFHGCADHEHVLPAHPEDDGTGYYGRLRATGLFLSYGHAVPRWQMAIFTVQCPVWRSMGPASAITAPRISRTYPPTWRAMEYHFHSSSALMRKNITAGCGINPLVLLLRRMSW